jgi:hypothetical protein
LTPEIYKSISALVELKRKIENTKMNKKDSVLSSLLDRLVYDFPLDSLFELDEITMIGNYETVVDIKITISSLQEELRELFEKILQHKIYIEDDTVLEEPLIRFLNIYNSEKMTKFIFDENGILIEVPNFDEKDLLDLNEAIPITGFPSTYIHFERLLGYSFIAFIKSINNRAYLGKCLNCEKHFIKTKLDMKNPQKFCRYNGDDCRNAYNNRRRIESGEAAEYKRKKRKKGAKPSYYG